MPRWISFFLKPSVHHCELIGSTKCQKFSTSLITKPKPPGAPNHRSFPFSHLHQSFLSLTNPSINVSNDQKNIRWWDLVNDILQVSNKPQFYSRDRPGRGACADITVIKALAVSIEPPDLFFPAVTIFSLAVMRWELTPSHTSPTSFQAAVTLSSSAILTPSFLVTLSCSLGRGHPECRKVHPSADHTSQPNHLRS